MHLFLIKARLLLSFPPSSVILCLQKVLTGLLTRTWEVNFMELCSLPLKNTEV